MGSSMCARKLKTAEPDYRYNSFRMPVCEQRSHVLYDVVDQAVAQVHHVDGSDAACSLPGVRGHSVARARHLARELRQHLVHVLRGEEVREGLAEARVLVGRLKREDGVDLAAL